MKGACARETGTADAPPEAIAFLKILAEPNRLKILRLLRGGERCVCEIWGSLRLPQNLVSHHLKELKAFGLVRSRKEGLKTYYSVDKPEMAKRMSSLKSYLGTYAR